MLDNVDILQFCLIGAAIILVIFVIFFAVRYGVKIGTAKCNDDWFGRLNRLRLELNEQALFLHCVANQDNWKLLFKQVVWTNERDIRKWAEELTARLDTVNKQSALPVKLSPPVTASPKEA